jgi:hypothetical protein
VLKFIIRAKQASHVPDASFFVKVYLAERRVVRLPNFLKLTGGNLIPA